MIGVSCNGGAAGRMVICVSGQWRAVCDDDQWNSWTNNAQVVCRQLGLNTQGIQWLFENT